MSDTGLNALLETVWRHLTRGAADRKHPARHPTLATNGPDGPELRTLVLRRALEAAAALDLQSDALSPKVAQITADPRVALHVWLPKPRIQIRMRATAGILPGDPSVFANLPPEAQANYQGRKPGTPLTDPEPEPQEGSARFIRITCALTEIDTLVLAEPHQRALYRRSDGWSGTWIAP